MCRTDPSPTAPPSAPGLPPVGRQPQPESEFSGEVYREARPLSRRCLFICPLEGRRAHQNVPTTPISEERSLTARERLRIHLREARRTADSPIVEAQLDAALDAWNDLPPTPLQECPVCRKVGLPERIQQHRCGTQDQNGDNIRF
jgi:hypothetical protein